MSVETFIPTIEQGLVRIVRLALGKRLNARANLAALATIPPEVTVDGWLCYVTSESVLYEWLAFSGATPNGSTVVASSVAASTGRWHKVVTPWTYGAGGAALATKQTGYLENIQSYSSLDGDDEALENCFAQTPSVLVQWEGDDPVSQASRPGTWYLDTLTYKLLIVTRNMQGGDSATQGTRLAADPHGAQRIIGDLRRVFCGLAIDSGIEGVERIQIGGARYAFEDVQRRVYVHEMDLVVKGSFSIEDEDLVDCAIRLQPTIVDFGDAGFDKLNFVASGGNLDGGPGEGFTRDIVIALATIAGSALYSVATTATFPADTDTYRDLAPDGTWGLSEVGAGADPPAQAAGTLRVAVTRTDGVGIVSDRSLCSIAIPFGDPFDL